MKTKLVALATATAISFAVVAPAANAMEMEFNMLTGAVYNALKAEGFDTTNIDQLTLGEVALIKALLEEDGMTSSTRGRIEKILSE